MNRRSMGAFARACLGVLFALVATVAQAKFLEPDKAFGVDVRAVDPSTIEARFRIADGYYLYREQFRFALDPATSGGAVLGEPVYPKGEVKYDEIFEKDVEHYRHEVAIRIPVTGAHGPVTLQATSQGCADAGLCYPPQTASVVVALGGTGSATPIDLAAVRDAAGRSSAVLPTTPASTIRSTLDDPSTIAKTLAAGRLGWIALVFVGLGLLLSFTPCVLPMVPILSAILVGADRGGRGGSFVLALAYSLGMALVYTALGVAAGLAGEGLAATLQAPWILATFAALLVALSGSMFGLYELQLPLAWQTRFTAWSDRAGGRTSGTAGRLAGVFAMGAVSALIVGPCVAAPLAGALVYIGQTRDVVVGGVALFSLAVGMSVPLLAIGASAGSLLPRVGAWMESVKRFFGALLIAVAIWMVAPVLPGWAAMLAWAVFAVVAAVWLRVFDPLAADAGGGARLAKGLGAVLLIAGAIELVGLATGGRDVLQPLGRLATAARSVDAVADAPPFASIKGTADLDRRVAAAGRPVLVDFYADWCVSCKEMERFTYGDARVAARMRDFVLLKADVTANDADDRALLKRFGLFGPPGIVFYDAAGRPLAGAAVIGYQDADRFLESLAVAARGS